MICRLWTTALLVLGLSACAELAPQRPGAPADAGAAVSVEMFPASDEINWGLIDGETAKSLAAQERPPKPRRKPDRSETAALAEPDPDLLVGLDFEATKALLGDPVLKMEQPPAKVWAYNGGACMFSVFFYPSMDDSVFRVLTYEMTGNAPELQLQTASKSSDTGAEKISDPASPILRRCFAHLLQVRDMEDAG